MKKAKLDILEELPEIDLGPSQDESISEAEVSAEVPDKGSRTWAFNKLLMIGAPVALVVILICSVLIYFLFFGKTPEHPKTAPVAKIQPDVAKDMAGKGLPEGKPVVSGTAKPISTVQEKDLPRIAYVKDFIIDLKDSGGNNRVLLCDLAFDLGPDQLQENFENNVAVRNIIYQTARNRSAVALKSVEERKKLKLDLTSEIDRMLGKGSVRNIYFTNYFIM